MLGRATGDYSFNLDYISMNKQNVNRFLQHIYIYYISGSCFQCKCEPIFFLSSPVSYRLCLHSFVSPSGFNLKSVMAVFHKKKKLLYLLLEDITLLGCIDEDGFCFSLKGM